MIPNKGKYTDCNNINQPPGTWRSGKNLVTNQEKAAFINEPGTDLTATAWPFEACKPIGSTPFPDGSYVQYGDGINGGKDRIGIVDKNGNYTDLIVDDVLNFDGSFPIRSSEIDFNMFEERIIGFTDFHNTWRVLNIDNLPFPLNPDKSLVSPADIADIEGFPKVIPPIITYLVNQFGGAVRSGAYSPCVAYENYDGTRAPNSPPYKEIYIADDASSAGYDKVDGVVGDVLTPKSITFTITNVDTRYDRLVLLLVRKRNGQVDVIEVKKIDINGSNNITTTYLGTETVTILPVDEVLSPRPLYIKAGCCAQLNSQIYLGNLVAQEDIEYQEIANNVKLFYNTKLVSIQNINDSHKNQLPGGFPHGGVGAFYIAFILKNGSWSRAFHIPGRTPLLGGSNETDIVRNKTASIVTPIDPGTWSPTLFSEIVFDNAAGLITTGTGINIVSATLTSYNGFKIVVAAGPSRVVFQHGFIGESSAGVLVTETITVTTASDIDPSPIAVPNGLPSGTKTYQVEDTTNRVPLAYSTIDGRISVTDLGGLTNMGYWANQNEVYPANFPGGLQGQPVRHHVFPTIRKCKEFHYNSVAGYGRDQFDILGIDVSNVAIPSDIADKVEGWGIFYADRTYQNSNTLGTDIYLVAHRGNNAHPDIIWSAGGNWKTRSFAGDGAWEEDFDTYPQYLRGHNFELLKDKPALSAGSVYIDFELKIRKENLLGDFLTLGKIGGNLAKSGEDEGQNAGAVIDLTDTQHTTVSIPTPTIRAIEEFKYLPTGVVDGDVMTLKNEEIIHLKVFNGNDIPFTISEAHVNSSGRDPGVFIQNVAGFSNGGEDTYMISYKQLKTDVYNEFTNQILVLTDQISLPSESFKRGIAGGDTFAGVRSFISMSPRHVNDFEKIHGTTVIRAHIAESRYNIGLRHETLGDVTTRYYPKTPAQNFWDNPSDPDENGVSMIFDRTQNPNGLAYNSDYNDTNKYSQLIIYSPTQRLTNKFPYRVIRGGTTDGTRTDINGWKTFLAADYYESNRNRESITDLFVLDDNLFIHHRRGLFRTLGTEKLSLETTEVYLGSGDIFAQRPKESVSTELGFLGNQNIFAGFTFKGNRFWVDQSQGRVFLISKQGVQEISANGNYNFFRDNLKINNDLPDSPIVGEGIIATYDSKFDRILLTKKSNVNPFTLSYSMDKEQNFWAFNHDYIPDYYFFNSDNFYGYKDNKIHKFNSLINKAKYFEGDIQTSEVELIFNEQPNRNKRFFNINWISEIKDEAENNLPGVTITAVRVKTSYQDSGIIPLIPYTTYGSAHNTRKFKNTWNFNKFKDIDPSPTNKRNMLDNWCSITFIYNNTPNLDDTQNSLYLYLLNALAELAEL